jgi:hypothetical protein
VAKVIAETGSLIATIERLSSPARGLRPLDPSVEPWLDQLVPDAASTPAAGRHGEGSECLCGTAVRGRLRALVVVAAGGRRGRGSAGRIDDVSELNCGA